MSYDLFRADYSSRLSGVLPDPALLPEILHVLDIVSVSYDIKKTCTDLIVYDGLPEPVRLYIASASIENLAKGTLEGYYRILSMFFSVVHKPVDQVTANDVRLYLHNYKLNRKVKDHSLDHIRICLNGFFEWCADEEIIRRNPIRKKCKIKYAEPERLPLSALELEKVRDACKDLREKAMVDFLYSTAARVSEFCALNKDDINWQEHTVRIRHGKGDKARTTFLNPEAEISLRAYLASRSDGSEALFVAHRAPHNRLGVKSVQDEIRRIVSRVKLSVHVTPHIFRHTAASLALQRCMPIEQVQKFLGHAKIQTTLRYAKVLDFDVRQNHARYVS